MASDALFGGALALVAGAGLIAGKLYVMPAVKGLARATRYVIEHNGVGDATIHELFGGYQRKYWSDVPRVGITRLVQSDTAVRLEGVPVTSSTVGLESNLFSGPRRALALKVGEGDELLYCDFPYNEIAMLHVETAARNGESLIVGGWFHGDDLEQGWFSLGYLEIGNYREGHEFYLFKPDRGGLERALEVA